MFTPLLKSLPVLLGTAVLLPCAVTLLVLFARFLSLVGNSFAASILDGTSLVVAILWLLDLVAILLTLAARAVGSDAIDNNTETE
ncbi:MAG: hypothetical protein ACRC46_11970 [Thermoguttaceae bacterium]